MYEGMYMNHTCMNMCVCTAVHTLGIGTERTVAGHHLVFRFSTYCSAN